MSKNKDASVLDSEQHRYALPPQAGTGVTEATETLMYGQA